MSAHVFLNLSNELGGKRKMRGSPSILFLFRNVNTRVQMLDDIKITLKPHFCHKFCLIWFFTSLRLEPAVPRSQVKHSTTEPLRSLNFCRENVIILSLCMQRCYGRHNASRKSVNLYWFIDFIASHFLLKDATS